MAWNDTEAAKAYRRAYYKAYRVANKDKIAAKKKDYRVANKDKIAAKKKAYAEVNKDKIVARNKAYYEANRRKISDAGKIYRETNRDKAKVYHKKYTEKLPLSRVAQIHNLPKPTDETTEGELALLEILRYNTLTKRLIKEAK